MQYIQVLDDSLFRLLCVEINKNCKQVVNEKFIKFAIMCV
jgi:hypothetical protein